MGPGAGEIMAQEYDILPPGEFAGEDSPAVQEIYARVAILLMERKTVVQIGEIKIGRAHV